MKILFFFFIILFMSCNASKWKQRYSDEYFIRIQQQYGSHGNINYAITKTKVPFDPVPHPDSNGFVPAKFYKPITSYKRKQVKKIMRGLEWSAAIVPDSINKENKQIDSIYMNPYKIRYLEDHHLKTDRMIFHDTTTRTSNRRV